LLVLPYSRFLFHQVNTSLFLHTLRAGQIGILQNITVKRGKHALLLPLSLKSQIYHLIQKLGVRLSQRLP
ncbi:hypothetical protein DK853_32600, partial [Klebsiella oxytoca]